jgi:hypothetical protein
MKSKTKKTYTSDEVAKLYNLSTPRLLQLRKGQIVNTYETVRGKKVLARSYSFPPILEEGKDWEWTGSEVVFFESALKKITNRKANRKHNGKTQRPNSTKVKVVKIKAPSFPKGAVMVPDVANEFKITVQQIYAIRDTSINKPRSFTNYLIKGKDWDYINGKVALYKSAIPKVKELVALIKQKATMPKVKSITALVGTKAFRISGADAQRIIDIIKANKKI